MTEKGLVEAQGEKRGRVYHLSAMLYEHFGNLPGYVRTRGFDKIQQKQMVLTALGAATDERVTREGVADLCKITKPKAYHLLKKMCD
ncbi:MAG: ATPase, partial [Desulfatirhabdiaceae bacterium]|nr:ATPase [Desulfatirhabdiaceae bacterium]